MCQANSVDIGGISWYTAIMEGMQLGQKELVASRVAQYRDSHHRVAQMFAAGCTPSMIRRQTGISMRRLTLLSGDPSFKELIAQYSSRFVEKLEVAQDAYLDTAIANMLRSEQQIADHLDQSEETGELLPINILDKISQGRADRFGYSKHSTMRVEHDFATALDKAIARSGKAEEMKTIEGTVASESSATSALPPSPGIYPPNAAAGGEGPSTCGETQRSAPRSFQAVLEIKRRRIA